MRTKVLAFLSIVLIIGILIAACQPITPAPTEPAAQEPAQQATQAPETAPKEKKLIGFGNLLRAGCDFCMDVENSIVKEFEAAGYEVFAVDNNFDLNTGLSNADTMVTKKVDFFIEFNGNLDVYPTIVAKMKAADPPIPIAFIDGPAPDEEGVWYFGASSPGSGKIAGEWTLDWVKKNWDGKIDGLISTWTSDWDTDTLGRLTEFMKVISAHDPNWTMDSIGRIDVKLEAEKAQAAFSAYLNAHPDSHNIIMYTPTNDVHALMALAAAQAAGREKDVLIVGLGCDKQAQAEFRKPDNAFKMSVGYFPDQYGKFLVTMVTDILAGKDVPRKVFMQHVPVTRENINQLYSE